MKDEKKRVGLIIGRERDWPSAFMTAVNERDEGVTAEIIKLSGTFVDQACPYAVIIDRKSHDIPYYRAYLEHAALQGCYVINNPFTCSFDSKFFGVILANKLGLTGPRTVVLPNKFIEKDVVPDSFRNLNYPMDWQGIIDYVGVPAIFKDINSGGRRAVYRVYSVDELIQWYDESNTRTMILQEIIESDTHIHCFVVGQQKVLPLQYSVVDGRYQTTTLHDELDRQTSADALILTRAYGYDINMVEFAIKNGQPYVINSTNPAPAIDRELMNSEQFNWCVNEIATLAINRAKRPAPQQAIFPFRLILPEAETG